MEFLAPRRRACAIRRKARQPDAAPVPPAPVSRKARRNLPLPSRFAFSFAFPVCRTFSQVLLFHHARNRGSGRVLCLLQGGDHVRLILARSVLAEFEFAF